MADLSFASDNWSGAAPEIIEVIARANHGMAPAYGNDELTKRTEKKFSDLFERDCKVFFVATGGAANGLALSVLAKSYASILCHEESHIQMDECAGPEFLTQGAKLIPVKSYQGKLNVDAVEKTIAGFPYRPPHGSPFQVLSLTQGTECGTIYSLDETVALCDVAKKHQLKVHMDGARFSNAVASLGVTPAQASWKAGVDVLCFGGTKNGCIAAEAVVFFNPDDAQDFEYRRKRAGHLWSKMRFIAAQFDAYLSDDLWLRLASHANEMAQKLSAGLASLESVKIAYPTEINEVFVSFEEAANARLKKAGVNFYPWATPGAAPSDNLHRLIASWATQQEDVDAFIATVRG